MVGSLMSRGFLLDTHIWLWHSRGDRRLSPRLRRLIDGNHRLWYSPLSIWEMGLLIDRNRIRLDQTLSDWVAARLVELPLEEAAVNLSVALEAAHNTRGDPIDRFLLATAEVYDLTLITVDSTLRGLPRTRSS
ncbi:MAG: type II toxin-antitoxin system VapC family toxin [Actinomycetota bacterium]